MVYIFKKQKGENSYYYLRTSTRDRDKVISKDIAYLGSDSEKIAENLENIPDIYKAEIRRAHKTINKFLQNDYYLQKAKKSKLKVDEYLTKDLLLQLESIKIHWNKEFLKQHTLTQEDFYKKYIVEFAYNSTSLEGNTITLKEAEKLLLENKTPRNKDLREIHDIKNTEIVFNVIRTGMTEKLNHNYVIGIHDQLIKDIDERVGYRTHDIRVFKSRFEATPAKYVKADMEVLFKWYVSNENSLHPVVLAAMFHHKFEKIHPFADGNGRTGRMLMNKILLSKGFPCIVISNSNRSLYLKSLSSADKADLNSIDVLDYNKLVEFISKEAIKKYWDIFL